MKKLLLVSLCFLVLCVTQVFAQNRTVTGTVTGSDDGLPIPGVTVKIKGTNVGTPTDVNGKYSISVSEGTTLVFSYIAYTAQEVAVGSKNVINVALVQNTSQLSEVVVTALGIQREAKSLGYSTSTVKSEDLTKARETNVLNSLAGQMAGVRVNNQSGTIGGSSKVIIRGVNSLDRGNSTLYVIDGLTVTEAPQSLGTVVSNVDYGNRMGDLSADDIESVTVLKGAAAAALYGNRAKDGAVIITTKRGKKNSKASIEFNSSYDFSNPLVLPKFQNEYAQGNQGVYALTQVNGWGPKIADVQSQKFPNFLGQQVTLQAYPNNVKDFFQTGHNALNNVAVSGGDDKSDYRFSFSSLNSKGIIPESKLDRYNLTINAGRKFSKTLSSRFTGSYTSISSDGRPAQASNNTNGIVNSIYGLPRTVDIGLLRDNFEDPLTGAQITLSPNRTGNNPYWIMKYNRNGNTVDRFLGTYNLTYSPVEWFTLTNTFGADVTTEKRFEHIRKGTAGFINGQFQNFDQLDQQVNDDLIATIEQNNLVKDFKFKLIVGGNINQRFTQSTNVLATNLTIDQLWNYTNAESKTPTLAYSKRRLYAIYGDLGINYKDYLYLNVTGRNDFTSTLPVASRSFFYPSVSGSFVFSELLKSNSSFSWLSSGKVRASWASVGSDLPPYQLDYQYTPVSTVFLQYVSSTATVFPAGPISTAFTGPQTLPNANLVPQKVNSFEIGTDLSFLNDRIGVVFNYYNSKITNQLIPITIPPSTGYRAKYLNIGGIRNSGIELELNTTPVKLGGGFRWDLGFNFAQNKQTVLELAPGLTQYTLASGYSGLTIKAEPGQSFGLFGSAWTKAPDGQYIITQSSGLRVAATNKRLGNIYADWTGGIKNTFSYRGFSLFALVDIRKGGVFYSGTVAGIRSSGLAAETGDRALRVEDGVNLVGGAYVKNTTQVNAQNYWVWNGSTTNTEANTFDAGFIKLRQVAFSYRLPSTMFKANSAIKGAQIGVEGNNLWLIKSHVPHVDPESNFFGAGSIGEGVEFNSIPSTRVIGMNLRLSF
jgi:TonB-linked SusC/RagA family outer membrane protein